MLALVLAIGGTAIAGIGGGGGASKKLSKAKVRAIATKQIKKLAPTLSVASADQAARADSADTARDATTVNGMAVKPVIWRAAREAGSPRTEIVSFPGHMTIDASCPNPGGLDLDLIPGEAGSAVTVTSMLDDSANDLDSADTKRDIASNADFDVDAGERYALSNFLAQSTLFPPLNAVQGTVQFRTPSNFVATVQFDAALTVSGGQPSCRVSGVAIGGLG